MREFFLDKERTQPLVGVVAWGVRHRFASAITPIAAAEERWTGGWDNNYRLMAQLADGQWVQAWYAPRAGAPRKAEGELSKRSIQRIKKGEQRCSFEDLQESERVRHILS